MHFSMSMRVIMTVVLCVTKRGILHVFISVVAKKLQETNNRKSVTVSFRKGKILNLLTFHFISHHKTF